jgi:hypothetical protein
VPGKVSGRALRLGGGRAQRLARPVTVRSEAAGEQIRAIERGARGYEWVDKQFF